MNGNRNDDHAIVNDPRSSGGARVATFRRQPNEYYDRYPRRAGSGYRRVDLPPDSSAPP